MPIGAVESCDLIRHCVENFPGRVESYVWCEDIDLNAAVGALACALGTLKAADQTDSDTYRLRKGYGTPEILAILGIDESGGGAGGYLTVEGRARKIRFGKISVVAAGEFWSYVPRRPIPVPEGCKLNCVGNQAGSGAEQHAVIVYVHYPLLGKPAMLQDIYATHGPVGLKTGTRVAATAGPFSASVLGGFEDSELSLSSSPNILYCLSQLINGPGLADTSVVVVRFSGFGMDYEIAIPASQAGSEVVWNFPEIAFTADNPLKLGAIGNSTTSDEYGLVIGANAPYEDTDAGNRSGSGQKRDNLPTYVSPISSAVTPEAQSATNNSVKDVTALSNESSSALNKGGATGRFIGGTSARRY